jgi:hypothetical protein
VIVSKAFQSLTQAVGVIIDALANRLTAADNWGPEGQVGQVLTSRGPGPNDPPPHFQDISGLITSNPVIRELITGPAGPAGPTGPTGPTGAQGPIGPAGFMPTYIAPGETFTIPANMQGLYALPIVNDGVFIIDGNLVAVS